MSISSLVIHAKPAAVAAVRERLCAIEGVEIHATGEDGRLIVTVDQPDERRASETLARLHGLDGVLCAALAYTQFEDESADKEAVR